MPDNPFTLVTASDLANGNLTMGANLLFTSASTFSHFIEQTALDTGKTCMSVILEYCDDKDIEPQDVSKLISPSLKGKVHLEMIEAGLMPEHTTLDQ